MTWVCREWVPERSRKLCGPLQANATYGLRKMQATFATQVTVFSVFMPMQAASPGTGDESAPRPCFPRWATGGHQEEHALTLRRWRNQAWVEEPYGRHTRRAPACRHSGGGHRRV